MILFRYIKMSSPRINGLICFGCILTYVAVIVWGVDLSNEASAKAACKVCEDIYILNTNCLKTAYTITRGLILLKVIIKLQYFE